MTGVFVATTTAGAAQVYECEWVNKGSRDDDQHGVGNARISEEAAILPLCLLAHTNRQGGCIKQMHQFTHLCPPCPL